MIRLFYLSFTFPRFKLVQRIERSRSLHPLNGLPVVDNPHLGHSHHFFKESLHFPRKKTRHKYTYAQNKKEKNQIKTLLRTRSHSTRWRGHLESAQIDAFFKPNRMEVKTERRPIGRVVALEIVHQHLVDFILRSV